MKRKIMSFALCCLLLVNGLLLSGCGECDHDWEDWETVTEPTCTEEGEKVRECDECGKEQDKSIKPLGHIEIDMEPVAATCTAEGAVNGTICKTCNTVLKAADVVPMLEHTYIESVAVEPTCVELGTKKFTCANCETFYTEDIPVVDHVYTESIDTPAKCDHSGTKKFDCNGCEDYYTEEYQLRTYTAQEIHEMVKNSVAHIDVYDKNGNAFALGSGFVYSEDGKFITNYHVINGATSAKLTINGKTYDVTNVVAYDKNIDLAIIQVNTTDRFTVIPLCETVHPTGSRVYTLGSSQGFTDTFAEGIISNSRRVDGNVVYIQHNADISSGNSGGPLFNEYCEIIGINTLVYTGNGGVAQNLNFSVAVEEINNLPIVNKTLAEVYEAEHDLYNALKENIIAYGEYDPEDDEYSYNLGAETISGATFGTYIAYVANEDYFLYVLEATDGVELLYTFIKFDKDFSGNYEWMYIDNYNNAMYGSLDATVFDGNNGVTVEEYVVDNVNFNELSIAVKVLLDIQVNYLTIDFESLGFSAADFGFVNY